MNDLLPMIFIPLLAAGVAYHAGRYRSDRRERLARKTLLLVRLLVADWRKDAKAKADRLDARTLEYCAGVLEGSINALHGDAPNKEAR